MSFYKDCYLWMTRWIVYFQSLEMILSNFNRYEDFEQRNFQGLNMLHTVFAMMFVIYNTFIGNLMMDNKITMYTVTALIWLI